MLFLLTFLGTAVYLQVGFQLGRIGWNAWTLRRRSRAAFFLFPVSWYRNLVGSTESVPLLHGINPPQGAYRTVLLLLWPLQLVRNLVLIIVFFGPDLLFRRRAVEVLTVEREKREKAEIERQGLLLEEQNRALDRAIWQLESGSDDS